MKNKILSLMICFVMVISSGFTVMAKNETGEVSFETKVMRGLFVIDSDFETNPNDEVSRGDFVRILMDMINAPGAEKLAVGGFKDISQGASYSKAVIYAANMGYIRGYDDGTFKANNSITVVEAVTTILKISGYDAMTNNSAYSKDYMSVASSQNLLRGISTKISSPMTKNDVAKLLYNTLTLEILSLKTTTSDGTVTLGKNGELFMEAFMDLSKYRGIVTSTYVTSLTGDSDCVKGEIKVGDTKFTSSYEKADEYLGYNVEAYTKNENNEDETLVYAIPYKNATTEVQCEDITADSTNTIINYEVLEEIRTQKIKVKADADKIVNGKADAYSSLTELISKSDTMLFIDNNDDGIAEVVVVFAYEEMYVGSVSLADEIIYSKYTFDGVMAELNLEEADELVITKSGAVLELKDIKAEDVITIIDIVTDNRRIVKIDISDKKISGNVTGIDSDENLIYIDNQEYKLSNMYNKALENKDLYAKEIVVNMSGTFYLNSFGRISVVSVDDTTKRYGFIKRAFIDDGMDSKVKFRILGTDGDWQLYETEEKIRIENEKVYAENIFENNNFSEDKINVIPQIVEFELSRDSKIKKINVATESNDYKNDSFRYKVVSNQPYRGANKSFNSKTYISGETVTFSIPKQYMNDAGVIKDCTNDELALIADKYFVVNTGSVYQDWTSYTLKAYNCDKFSYTDLITRDTLISDVGEFGASNFLFNKLSYVIGSDDTEQVMIEGLHGTNISASAYLGNDVKVNDSKGKPQDLSYIQRGDLLKLYLDVDNNVHRIDVVFKVDKNMCSNVSDLHVNDVCLYGRVNDIDHDRGFVLLQEQVEMKSIKLYNDKISVYKYDMESKNESISIGNINDIQKGDYILMKGNNSVFDFIVIYE